MGACLHFDAMFPLVARRGRQFFDLSGSFSFWQLLMHVVFIFMFYVPGESDLQPRSPPQPWVHLVSFAMLPLVRGAVKISGRAAFKMIHACV